MTTHYHTATYVAGEMPLEEDIFHFETFEEADSFALASVSRMQDESAKLFHKSPKVEMPYPYFYFLQFPASTDTIVVAVYECWACNCETANMPAY